MKYLPETVVLKGLGIPGLTAQFVDRNDWKAIYLRSDGYYEVFHRKFNDDREIFGKQYESQEWYPSNNDFGRIAWCIRSEEKAWMRYRNLKQHDEDDPE